MPIKVVDLPAENAPTDDDLVIIRDNLTGTTRKITRTVFFQAPPIGVGVITSAMLADGAVSKIKLGVDAKIGVRTITFSSPGTLLADIDNYDVFAVTNLNSSMTVGEPIGTPVNGQGLMFRFKDNGTARAIAWNAIFRAIGITTPITTVANKMVYVSGRWNAEAAKWDLLSVGREA